MPSEKACSSEQALDCTGGGLSRIPPDLLVGEVGAAFLGWKAACRLAMTNSNFWSAFTNLRFEKILIASPTKDASPASGGDINAMYIESFITTFRSVMHSVQRLSSRDVNQQDGGFTEWALFEQIAVLERIVDTMPEPARDAIKDTLPALSSKDTFAPGTLRDHVITGLREATKTTARAASQLSQHSTLRS